MSEPDSCADIVSGRTESKPEQCDELAPMVGCRAGCCARAVSGHVTTVLLKSLMNSRRLMGFTPLAENHLRESLIRSASESYATHCSRKGALMSALGQKQTS